MKRRDLLKGILAIAMVPFRPRFVSAGTVKETASSEIPPAVFYKPGLHLVDPRLLWGQTWTARHGESDRYFSELCDSIREHGIYVPVLTNQRLEIIDGVRRMMAARALGLKQIPVQVVLTDQ